MATYNLPADGTSALSVRLIGRTVTMSGTGPGRWAVEADGVCGTLTSRDDGLFVYSDPFGRVVTTQAGLAYVL